MARAAGGPGGWLDGQVRSLLQHYRQADAIAPETAAAVERHIENGAAERALEELLDAADD